jgi:hypothetical protein
MTGSTKQSTRRTKKGWIASSQELLAMTKNATFPADIPCNFLNFSTVRGFMPHQTVLPGGFSFGTSI